MACVSNRCVSRRLAYFILDMIKQLEQVEEFVETFSIPRAELGNHNLVPLIEEELMEYIEAVAKNDIVEIADAGCDLMVYVLQIMLGYGFSKQQMLDAFDEVCASNMSKSCSSMSIAVQSKNIYLDKGVDCYIEQTPDAEKYVVKRTSDNKVLKGIEYFKPDIKHILGV